MPEPHADPALAQAIDIARDASRGAALRPEVASFFDPATNTVSHVVCDPGSRACAIIDSVLDFDPASGRTQHASADALLQFIRARDLQVQWVLETHAHADHFSAAPWLQEQVGGQLAIGERITVVQHTFGKLFNAGTQYARDGSQFDRLFADGDRFRIGSLDAAVLQVPGHTPACIAYVIGDAVFAGDTLFMPDYGTARCDFPGGDAATLYRSIRRLLRLPGNTRMFLCHDYKAPGRDHYAWETSVAAQRSGNIHVREDIGEAEFVTMRQARDATLSMPRLILPSIQVNMRGGRWPEPEDNGISYLTIPLNAL